MVAIWADEAGPADAPLVVLIHGSMDRSAGLLRLSRRLDQHFRVLRYDRRGYGKSVADSDQPSGGLHPGPFDMEHQVSDLFALLAGRTAVLVGHSYGGNVALASAARHPDSVAGVAAYETPMSWEPWWPTTTAGALARADNGDAGDAAERFMRRLVGDATWEDLPERTRLTRRREGPALVGELSDLHDHRPWRPEDIHCPVVLSFGSLGAAHHHQGMARMHGDIPASTLIELPGCRHDAPMSHSELFATTVVAGIATAAGQPWARAAVGLLSSPTAASAGAS